MPIFEYRCTACGVRYEALVSRADRATPHCPRCGAARAERLISTFAVGRSQAEAPSPGPCGAADCACRMD
ncbi:MAG: zinc ribbon domain-containing protein [Candidatus Eisenbacteria bacterium]